MLSAKDFLELFRDLKITKAQLYEAVGRHEVVDSTVMVGTENLIHLLTAYREGSFHEQDVLDWVNVIWFSGWYEYEDAQSDCIASVMNELEEIDEGKHLNYDRLATYLSALIANKEL